MYNVIKIKGVVRCLIDYKLLSSGAYDIIQEHQKIDTNTGFTL